MDAPTFSTQKLKLIERGGQFTYTPIVSIKNKEIIPFEEWEKKRLSLSYLCTWGCLAKVNVSINKKHKLGQKTIDCVFLDYAFHNMRYRFLIICFGIPNMHVGRITESKDAQFFIMNFL